MSNKTKSRLLSGKKVAIILSLMLLFSCSKIEPTIAWEKNTTFAEILKSADEKYVMLDFIKDN
jgi:hypothetical protein